MSKINKLAIKGGKKIIHKKNAKYVWPKITKKIERKVIKQLHETISIYNREGIFKTFEDSFAKMHNKKYSLLCNSGTNAIHTMYVACNFSKNDEVICPAYTFFATVTPLLFTGAKPVLCDCDENGNIDPREIIKKITLKTKAVVITHMWGMPCQMNKILQICKKNNLLLLEDCSHAHGATYNKKYVGSFGDMAAWSLQGSKNITGGEGGILVTNNVEFYNKSLLLGHYNKRCKQEISKSHKYYKYAVTGMGLKHRAHPLAVSIANEILINLEKNYKIKRFFANKIIKDLSSINGLTLPVFNKNTVSPSWYGMIFRYNDKYFDNLSIDLFCDALKAEGLIEVDIPVSTSPLNLLPLFQNPKDLFPIYKKNPFKYEKGDFPKAERFYKNIFKIPIWTEKIDSKVVNKYIKGIIKVTKNYKELL